MPDPLRVGLVGAGLVADLHRSGVEAVEGTTLVGVADLDATAARTLAERSRDGAGAYGSLDVMLDEAAPDVVHILTPPTSHRPLAEAALARGAHVYVEKPMAASVEDCRAMADASRAAGRALCVGHCLVQDPLMDRARAWIDEGQLGEIVTARAVYVFDPERIPGYGSGAHWYASLAGGFLEDLLPHPTSLLVDLLGPVSVVGVAGGGRGSDRVEVLVEAADGRTASILVGLSGHPEDVSLELRGERATARLSFSHMVATLDRERGIPRAAARGLKNLELGARLIGGTVASTARFALGRLDTTKGIHTTIGRFYDAIRDGSPPPSGPADGEAVVRVLRTVWPAPAPTDAPDARAPRRAGDLDRPAPASSGERLALVTGATGFIGRHLVDALLEGGYRVRVTVRRAEQADDFPDGVDVRIADLVVPHSFEGVCQGVDRIFHLASIMRGGWDAFRRADVGASRVLLDDARRHGVRRFVYASTMAVYALADLSRGDRVDDDTPVDEPDNLAPYARAKLEIEAMVLEGGDGAPEGVVLRPALVYGPGQSPFLDHLPHLGRMKGDRYLVFGSGHTPLPLTYVGNVVDAFLRAAESDRAPGNAYFIVDEEHPTQREFAERMAGLTGRDLRVNGIPAPVAWSMGVAAEAVSRLKGGGVSTSRRLIRGKSLRLRYDAPKAREDLGWEPRVGLDEGLREAVRAWPQPSNV